MRIMGLSDTVYNVTWLVVAIFQSVLTALLMTMVGHPHVFQYSDPKYIFLFLWSYALSTSTLCFLLSTFFSKSKTAATLGTVIFFALYFPVIMKLVMSHIRSSSSR